jgi:hypothetical protein
VGPDAGGWDRGGDMKDDNCGRKLYKGENLIDQTRIFCFEGEYEVG